MKKKDIEIDVKDTDTGTALYVGNKMIGYVVELGSNFEAYVDDKKLASYKNYGDAEEEIIKNYNLNKM
jgi:hypothetical protein